MGHSAGATLAFQLHNSTHLTLPTPAAVLGISGIYNFEAFLEAHSSIPAYQEFMENAFPDKASWEKAAPYTNRESDPAIWQQAKAIIIAHSKEDELVEKEQASFMLERARQTPCCEGKVHYLETTGLHNGIWQSGDILAGLITRSLQILGSGV